LTDEQHATGVPEAILVDLLLGLDVEPDSIMAMSNEERIGAVLTAVEDGRLPSHRVSVLRDLGVFRALGESKSN
jgi:hypothetical protein